MVNCQQCGAELRKHAKFCENCGETVQESRHEEVSVKASSVQRKPLPKWYVITTMVLSLLLAVSILGAVFKQMLFPALSIYWYALIVYGVGVVPVALFHIAMIIIFKAKRYERSTFTLPWMFLLLYIFTAGVISLLTFVGLFYLDPDAGWILLGNNILVGFLILCFGLYYLLRE